MEIYRNARPDEIENLAALADRVFRKPEQTSMGAAYSLLFSEENASRILVAEEDGLPVSMVGLIRNDICVSGCSLNVVSMGAVCTDPQYRGRNFAGTLVGMAVKQCEEEGIHLLLVSGNRRLYRRNECFEVGGVKTFNLNPADLDGTLDEQEIAPVITAAYDESRDLEAMLELMEMETAYYHRTPEQFRQLIQNEAILSNDSKRQKIAVGRSNSTAVAYVVFGVWENNGEEVAEVIEYAGDDQAVIKVLRDMFVQYGVKKLKISAGIERQTLAGTLASSGCKFKTESISGTIRMINFMKLWEALRPYIQEKLGNDADKLVCTEVSNGYRMAHRGEEWVFDTAGANQLTFNGPPMKGGDLKNVLSSLFPLPFVSTKNLNFT